MGIIYVGLSDLNYVYTQTKPRVGTLGYTKVDPLGLVLPYG